MDLSNKTTTLGIAALVVVLAICAFFLFKAGTAKEAGTMDPNSQPISHMQDFGKKMMQGAPTQAPGAPGAPSGPGGSPGPGASPPAPAGTSGQ